MNIEPIRNNLYDDRGGFQRSERFRALKKKSTSLQVPTIMDAVTFETINESDLSYQQAQDHKSLVMYINAIPDEEVSRKMKMLRSTSNDMESILVEKLIMDIL